MAIANFEGDTSPRICTQFHFKHPVTRENCRADLITAGDQAQKGEQRICNSARYYNSHSESETNNKVSGIE
jgi:hypothetical protein